MATKRDLLQSRVNEFVKFLESKPMEGKHSAQISLLKNLSLDQFIYRVKTDVLSHKANLEAFVTEYAKKFGVDVDKLEQDDKIKVIIHMKAFCLIAKHL